TTRRVLTQKRHLNTAGAKLTSNHWTHPQTVAMTRRAKQYRPRQFKKFSSSNNVFVAGAKGHQIKISFPCATQREQMNYAVIFRRSVSTFSTLANSFSAIKKTGRTEEARPGNHSGLFYLVAAAFDGL